MKARHIVLIGLAVLAAACSSSTPGGDSVDFDVDDRQPGFDINYRQSHFNVDNPRSDDIDNRQPDDVNHGGLVDNGVSAVPGGRHGRQDRLLHVEGRDQRLDHGQPGNRSL